MKLFGNLNKVEEYTVFTADKCIQTDDLIVIKKCDIEIQTDNNNSENSSCSTNLVNNNNNVNKNKKQFRSVSLLDLPLPDPKDVLQSLGSDFIDKNNPDRCVKTNSLKTFNDTRHLKETVAKVQPQPRKPYCKVLSNNIFNEEDFAPESKRRKLNSVNNSVFNLNSYNDSMNNITTNSCSSKQIFDNYDLINMLTDNNCTNDNVNETSCPVNSNLLTSQNDVNGELTLENNINEVNFDEIAQENVISLDDRIAELGYLLNEDSNLSSCNKNKKSDTTLPDSIRGRRSSWFFEMTAYYCNFGKVFLSLDDNKKIKVRERLNQIFGDNSDSDCDNIVLTENNLSICRKRTANMVVAELTPYFEAKKIPTRHLFKEFAKRVTDSILSRTYASGIYDFFSKIYL